ncbi:MAG: DUF2232 domain-containing protein [Rhodospirillaceae bacterium]|nr:DUF2232 domain-containing protein [Rhodospirillaceae bacterium]
MYKETTVAIGAGLASALLSVAIAFGSGLGLLLVYFALLPILLIGLSQGHRSGSIAAIAGVFGTIFLTNIFQGALYSVSVALPAWLVVRYGLMSHTARDGSTTWFPIGEILARLAALGGIALVLGAITYFDAEGGIVKVIEEFLDKILAARLQFGSPAQRHLLVERLVPLFPAISAASWILMTLVNSLLAQTILIRAGRNLRPAAQYSSINAPEWLYWGLVGAGLMALLGSGSFEYVGRNLAIVLAIPFFFIGLGVIHTLAKLLRSPSIALTAFYFLMVISSWAIFVVAIIGFFEEWNDLRHRFGAPAREEDEKNE